MSTSLSARARCLKTTALIIFLWVMGLSTLSSATTHQQSNQPELLSPSQTSSPGNNSRLAPEMIHLYNPQKPDIETLHCRNQAINGSASTLKTIGAIHPFLTLNEIDSAAPQVRKPCAIRRVLKSN